MPVSMTPTSTSCEPRCLAYDPSGVALIMRMSHCRPESGSPPTAGSSFAAVLRRTAARAFSTRSTSRQLARWSFGAWPIARSSAAPRSAPSRLPRRSFLRRRGRRTRAPCPSPRSPSRRQPPASGARARSTRPCRGSATCVSSPFGCGATVDGRGLPCPPSRLARTLPDVARRRRIRTGSAPSVQDRCARRLRRGGDSPRRRNRSPPDRGPGAPATANFPTSSAHAAPFGSTRLPPRQGPTEPVGLYDPGYEHDACGVAFVARLSGEPSHETVQRAITALENLDHRGAAGAGPNTGDGAGMLLQLPDELLRGEIGSELPPAGRYGVAVCFLPPDEGRRAELEQLLADAVEAEGQRIVTWRDTPVEKDYVGITANWFAPYIKQLVVAASPDLAHDQDAFERKLYVIRRVAELAAGPDLVIPSFSSRTIVYKGMLTAPQLLGYYPDLQDPRTKTALALVHSRFSTNTFPSWELAHPYRYIAHNGEINTLRGNVNWMRARESQLASDLFGADLAKVLPVVRPGGSDSATFDNVLELLVLAGRSLPHAVMMMIPEAYEGRDDLPEDLKAFYAFHSCLMEPWDGPAAVAFTDGRVIGATLDRNGLRPGRWLETKDGWVVLGSETGVMDEPASNILRKGRLQPGKLFLVDVEDVKREVATQAPYGEWFESGIVHLGDLPERQRLDPPTPAAPTRERQLAFGYSQ